MPKWSAFAFQCDTRSWGSFISGVHTAFDVLQRLMVITVLYAGGLVC